MNVQAVIGPLFGFGKKCFFMVDIILDEKKKAVVLQGNSSYCKCEQNNPDYPPIHVVRSTLDTGIS